MKLNILFITLLVFNFTHSQMDSYSMAQYYESGKIKSAIDHSSGEFKFYHENGNLKERGYYETTGIVSSTKKTGYWSTFDEQGFIIEVIRHKEDGTSSGKGTFDENGKLVSGEWSEFFNNGNTYFNANFDNYVKQGSFTSYYSNGKIKQTGEFSNNKKTGKWKFYGKEEMLRMEGSFLNGKHSGTWRVYDDETGVKTLIANYVEGERNGETILFYKDGETYFSKGNYEMTKKTGEWWYYHKNGKLYQQKEYSNDKLLEIVATYDGEGKELDKGTLKNGNGTTKEYSIDGKFIKEKVFVNGREVK